MTEVTFRRQDNMVFAQISVDFIVIHEVGRFQVWWSPARTTYGEEGLHYLPAEHMLIEELSPGRGRIIERVQSGYYWKAERQRLTEMADRLAAGIQMPN